MIPFALHLSNILMFQFMMHQLADLSFGQRQVEQFISDCPDTREIIRCNPALQRELVWRFAGMETGFRVQWDNREPIGPQPAEHMRFRSEYPAVIRISRTNDAIDKCFSLLFELNNFPPDKEVERLWKAKPEERPSRDNFAVSCVRHEFDALKTTRLFFKQHPIADEHSNSGLYYNSVMATNTADFTNYLMRLASTDKSQYNPLEYFGKVYDHEMTFLRNGRRRIKPQQ